MTGDEIDDDGRRNEKSADAYRTISEVSSDIDVPQHVLRFWETKFPQIRPLKRAGGRRYYRPEDILLLRQVREWLYVEGYTIKGVQKILREGGVKAVLQERGGTGASSEDGATPRPGDGSGSEVDAGRSAAAAVPAAAPVMDSSVTMELRSILGELGALRDRLRRGQR